MGVKVHLETEGEAGKGSQLQLPKWRKGAEPWSLRVRDLCLGGARWSSGDGKAMLKEVQRAVEPVTADLVVHSHSDPFKAVLFTFCWEVCSVLTHSVL